MAKLVLEQAFPAQWIDKTFNVARQRQYLLDLLFLTIVELKPLLSLGVRTSLHAAARQMDDLPLTISALYDNISRAEPELLRA